MHRDTLLLDLYACPAQPERWTAMLDRVCETTGAASAVLQAFRFDRDMGRLLWQATDRRTASRPAPPMATTHNPRMQRHRSLRGLGRVVTDDELFDRDDPAREALQRELAQVGVGRFMGLLQQLDGETYLAVALHRDAADRSEFNQGSGARLAWLGPHLRQAVQLSGRLQQGEHARAHLENHLDGLRCGLLICGRNARVQWMNRNARMLTDGSRELLVQGGLLRARQPSQTRTLHDEIALAGPAPSFVALGAGVQALHVALRTHGPAAAAAGAEGSVLLAVGRAGDSAQVPLQAWSRLLGVTPAEAALVSTLAAGGTLEQHAQQRGVSVGTVRGQLKQVLAKTGTHRQAELVRLALGSAATHLLDSVA